MTKLSRISKVLFASAIQAICLQAMLAPLTPAQSSTTELGQSGFWSLYVYMNDDGTFGHCGMRTGSKVGTETLTMAVGSGGYFVFLDDQHWSLNVGDFYDSETEVGGKIYTGKAQVYSTQGVSMRFSFDSGFGEAFETSTAMTFKIGNFARSLSLQGAKEALTQLASCVQKYMPSTNPFKGDSETSDPFRN